MPTHGKSLWNPHASGSNIHHVAGALASGNQHAPASAVLALHREAMSHLTLCTSHLMPFSIYNKLMHCHTRQQLFQSSKTICNAGARASGNQHCLRFSSSSACLVLFTICNKLTQSHKRQNLFHSSETIRSAGAPASGNQHCSRCSSNSGYPMPFKAAS